MIKNKTKSSIKKRFKITANGNIKAFSKGRRDHMLHKSSASLRRKGPRIFNDMGRKLVMKFGGF